MEVKGGPRDFDELAGAQANGAPDSLELWRDIIDLERRFEELVDI